MEVPHLRLKTLKWIHSFLFGGFCFATVVLFKKKKRILDLQVSNMFSMFSSRKTQKAFCKGGRYEPVSI